MSLSFTWKIPLKAPPDKVWRYIADTNRVNQYAGLPEFTFRYIPEPDGGSRQVGETRYMGWRLKWDERPFEWIEGRYFEVVRSYHNGPIRTFQTAVTLHPDNGGSLVEQTITCVPRWFFAVPAILWEVGIVSRRRFKSAYQAIDRLLENDAGTPPGNTPRSAIPPGRIETIRQRLSTASGNEWLPRLIADIESLPDDELDRMRPYVFADRWKADRRSILKLFLYASQAGLLDLSWDVICPSCRGAPERHQTMGEVQIEAHCPACNIKYDADFAKSVELTFRPNAAIRRVVVARYCSGGPMNAPHVVAQQQVPGRQSRTLNLTLDPWKYRVRSLKLQEEIQLQVANDAGRSEAAITLQRPAFDSETVDLTPACTISLQNREADCITVTIERAGEDGQAATAAFVIAMDEFRTLFSEEVLKPGMPISVGAITLMFTDLKSSTMLYEDIGEAPAYGLVRRHFELLRDCIRRADGALIKTIGDAVMAAFIDPAKAVEAAFEMQRAMAEDNLKRGGPPALSLKIGIHHGPCIAVNLNDILDYFGTAVNLAARIQKESAGDDIVMTDDLWADPHVQDVLKKYSHQHLALSINIRGLSGTKTVHRLIPGGETR